MHDDIMTMWKQASKKCSKNFFFLAAAAEIFENHYCGKKNASVIIPTT